jgi:xylulokinase
MRTVTWAHIVPGLLIPSGTMQTAGAAFSWAQERLYPEYPLGDGKGADVYDRINADIASSKAGANALLFLPYLLGERCPRWNSDARGSFIGLKMEHTRGDMMRSVVEGVAMNLDIILNILKQAVDIKKMIVVGGLAKGEVQQQIFADVYGMDVVRLKHLEEATSIGAAVIAGVGAGVLSGYGDALLFNEGVSHTSPVPIHIETYAKLKTLFEQSYEGQLRVFTGLAALQNS